MTASRADLPSRPENIVETWKEGTCWQGGSRCSLATGNQWDHETLHKDSLGRYWIESLIRWQSPIPKLELVSSQSAAGWLTVNGHGIPDDLAGVMAMAEEDVA